MIYKGARAVIQSGAQLGTSQKFADASARKAQDVRKTRESAASAKERVGAVEETLEGAGVRGDDGVPPGYPTVTAESFFHQVDLYWPRPPASDEVAGSLVRIRPENEASRIVSRPAHGSPATIKNLPYKPHTFEVLLFDKWGRESLWSDAVTATPMLTAAEEIDLSEIAMLGRLRGLLPDTNLATITDATKLGAELVQSGAIAPGAVTGPKLPDGVISGPKLSAGAVTGAKIAAGSVMETNIADGGISAPKLAAGAVIANKIAAGAVETPALAAGSVDAGKIAAGSVTTPKLAAGSVVADTIAADAVTAPKILADQIQTRHIVAGAVTAQAMAAQDAAAFNLWAQNAMIRSAAIQSLTADKIAAGAMTAGQITLAGGGSIKAGEVMLSANGLRLPGLATGEAIYVSEYQSSKISDNSGKSAFYFRQPADAGDTFAAVIQSEAGNQARGMSALAGVANADDWNHPANAMVRVGSYRPSDNDPSFISTYGANAAYKGRWTTRLVAEEGAVDVVALNGYAEVEAHNGNANLSSFSGGSVQLYAAEGTINCNASLRPRYIGTPTRIGANGGWVEWTHGSNRRPDMVMGWRGLPAAGDRQPLPTPSGYIFIAWCDANRARIVNNGPSADDVSISIY